MKEDVLDSLKTDKDTLNKEKLSSFELDQFMAGEEWS